MEFLLGIGVTLYALGLLVGLCFFCLHIGLQSSDLPFPIRLMGALLAAILWPLGFALYGPFMVWKREQDQRSHEKMMVRWRAEKLAGWKSDSDC